jgi:hypothetical protein
MKNNTMMLAGFALVSSFILHPSFLRAQGALTPPGAPAPTMKSLDQIEARTPISSLPYTITNPGSYYVTANLSGDGSDGIDITTNDVTLDLNGFTLYGAGRAEGINVINPAGNLVIRNGVVDFWGGVGVNANNAYNSQFERLCVSSNYIGLWAGSSCIVSLCAARGNTINGIEAGNNSVVKECIGNANGNNGGIFVGNDSTIIDCNAIGNSYYGILVGNNSVVKDGNASGNNIYGIYVGTNSAVRDCNATGNGSYGIYVGGNNSAVRDCIVSGNGNGIYVPFNNCQFVGNTCSGNSGYGILIIGRQNRVDGNNVGNNGNYGINDSNPNVDNSITRNFSPGPGYGGYGGSPNNNDYAPIQSPTNTVASPWANFQ